MLFNSLEFAAFFAIFYVAYLLLFRWRRLQNVLLLVASYVFYGWWDWRFLSLVAISTVVDYAVGRGLAGSDDPVLRKRLEAQTPGSKNGKEMTKDLATLCRELGLDHWATNVEEGAFRKFPVVKVRL